MASAVARRAVLRAAVFGVATVAVAGCLGNEPAPPSKLRRASAQPGTSPYGSLGAPDVNGIRLPEGFRSAIVARSGEPVRGTNYRWHAAPDGGACFPAGPGWIYVSNSEVENHEGGVSAIRFRSDGAVESAYRILGDTNRNCAGGPTPWGTWLSCEEFPRGQVYETYPEGGREAVLRPAMGVFTHEAAACDPGRKVVYLTEDRPDGCFYRFRPRRWGDLSVGSLEVLVARDEGERVAWRPVPDPDAETVDTRNQVRDAWRFNGGEGCYYGAGTCWFTTKGDNRVWAYDAERERLTLAYDDSLVESGEPPLTGVDNVTGSSTGDLFIAEDGPPDMQLNLITPEGVVAPFLQVGGQNSSELAGPAFSPDGSRLYFSSQRGPSGEKTGTGGITYEVTGPFRRVR